MNLTVGDFQCASDIETAAELVERLGDLAQWVIRDETLQQAAQRKRRSEWANPPGVVEANKIPGGALPIFVGSQGSSSILRSAYLVPMHWQSGGTHDERLPERLRHVADEVLRTLCLSGYSIHLMLPGQIGPTGKFLPDAVDGMSSTFASLACALKMLVASVKPDYRVVCTGRNENGRIGSVKYTKEKTLAVIEFPPRNHEKRFINWFVPPGECGNDAADVIKSYDSCKSKPTAVLLREFPETDKLDKQLSSLLACSGVKPQPDSHFATLQDYYQWLLELDPQAAKSYYYEVLYPQILARGFVEGPPPEVRPTHFVAVVSTPALIGLAHQLFQFQRVLILHTIPQKGMPGHTQRVDYTSKANAALDLFDRNQRKNVSVKPIVYQPELSGENLWASLETEMAQHVHPFLDSVELGHVMWDMTSGLRIFSHILEKSFARKRDWMLTINQQWSGQSEFRIPCTETLVVWQHKD